MSKRSAKDESLDMRSRILGSSLKDCRVFDMSSSREEPEEMKKEKRSIETDLEAIFWQASGGKRT